MQAQKTLESSNVSVPKTREEAFLFFKEAWKAISHLSYEESMEIGNSIKKNFSEDKEIQGCVSLLMATLTVIRSNYKEAISFGYEGLGLFESANNKEGEGACYVCIGTCYRGLGDNDNALNYIQKGLSLIPENSIFIRFIMMGYYQGAELFFSFNKLRESHEYFKKALSFAENDLWMKARLLSGIGNLFLKQKNFEEANKLLHESYDLVKEKENHLLNARLLSDLSSYYIVIKNYSEALEYENKSYDLRKELKLKGPQITNLLNFYKIYNASGEKEKALASLEEAFSIAKEFDLKGRLTDIYEKKVEYFENQGEFEEALKELKNYVSSRENEINASFDLKIKGINAVHEVEFARKEAEITKEKNKALSEANDKINAKNKELKLTLDELTRTKISRKSVMVTLVIGIALCLLTEAFVDPWVDDLSYNNYISLAIKALIAISLKPIDTLYENYMIKKALK